MISELLGAIKADLQTHFNADSRVKVSTDRLALRRRIPDADSNVYLDVLVTSLESELTAKQATEYTAAVDLRVAGRVKNEAEISSLVSFTDELHRVLSKGWTVAGFTLVSTQWQGVDRITDVSDVFTTFLSFTFRKTLYK